MTAQTTTLKPLEETVLQDFGCTKFIYCSDAGLGSEKIKNMNHAGERAFIVTQSIKIKYYISPNATKAQKRL